MRTSKPISVALDKERGGRDRQLASGSCDSTSEKRMLDEILQQRVRTALDDSRSAIPVKEVFDRLERKHADRLKAARLDV